MTRTIIAFDVDGTLTWTDSYLAFLRAWAGAGPFAARMAALAPLAAGEALGLVTRDALKAASVRAFFAGADLAAYRAAARRFGADVIVPFLLRADATAAVARARASGATIALVSASLEDYLLPLAERLGADAVLATRLEADGGRLTGRLLGRNCRAEEKVARLRAAFGPDLDLAEAYGDTSGDAAMLAAAGRAGYRVFADRPADAFARRIRLYRNGSL